MSKYILDENLSAVLVKKLANYLPLMPVRDIALTTFSDHNIWHHAKGNGYTIITKDNDFLYLSNIYSCPPKVIKLNCGNRSTSYITELIIKKVDDIKTFCKKL